MSISNPANTTQIELDLATLDAKTVDSEPVDPAFKKVVNIYIEPVTGKLIVVHEE